MLRLFSFLILLCCSFYLMAQTEFSRTIDTGGPQEHAKGIGLLFSAIDSTIIIQSANSCDSTICAGICKVDRSGDLIWSSIFTTAPQAFGFVDFYSASSLSSLVITHTGDIAVCGFKQKQNPIESDYFLMLVNSENGDSLWTKVYPDAEDDDHDLAKVLVQFEDGGFLIGGVEDIVFDSDIRLLRINSAGEILWEKSYEDILSHSNIYSLRLDNEENILIGAEMADAEVYIGILSDEQEGAIIQDANWGMEGFESGIYLDVFQDGSGYVGAWCNRGDLSDSLEALNIVRKVDGNLATIWEYLFDPVPGIERCIRNIKTLSDGSVLGLGSYSDSLFFDHLEDAYGKLISNMAWLFKISPEGELEWERVFYDSQFVHFCTIYDMLQTPDGSIYTLGQTTDSLGWVPNSDSTDVYQLYDENIWLTRFDENGCFNGDCGPPYGSYWDLSGQIIVPIEEVAASQPLAFQVYPNPSSGVFRIKWEEATNKEQLLQVYDLTGRVVLEQTAASNTTIVEVDLSAYPAGVYWVRWGGEVRQLMVLNWD